MKGDLKYAQNSLEKARAGFGLVKLADPHERDSLREVSKGLAEALENLTVGLEFMCYSMEDLENQLNRIEKGMATATIKRGPTGG